MPSCDHYSDVLRAKLDVHAQVERIVTDQNLLAWEMRLLLSEHRKLDYLALLSHENHIRTKGQSDA